MNDEITVREGGAKLRLRKYLLQYRVFEVYSLFLEANPQVKVGLTKFQSLRPKNVLPPNYNGMHSICCCIGKNTIL